MQTSSADSYFMQRCLQLAACGRSLSRPNPMVGAVIVAPDAQGLQRLLGEGYHVRCGEGHAEVNAFASVAEADEQRLSQATLYVSLEPCSHHGKTPPCCDLIIRKGVRRVVVGCVDPFPEVQGRGIRRLREAGIEVTVGVLQQECRWLNRRFFTFHEQQRPYIILKWAQSADGFLDDHGRAVALSSPFTLMLVHQLRAREDAIVVGRTTWQREQPQLNVRHWAGRNPERFVLSTALPPVGGVTVVPSVQALFDECRQRRLQSLVVEGGRTTLDAFLQAGLWDELRIETAHAVSVGAGTPAPSLPADAILLSRQHFSSNTIATFRHP